MIDRISINRDLSAKLTLSPPQTSPCLLLLPTLLRCLEAQSVSLLFQVDTITDTIEDVWFDVLKLTRGTNSRTDESETQCQQSEMRSTVIRNIFDSVC